MEYAYCQPYLPGAFSATIYNNFTIGLDMDNFDKPNRVVTIEMYCATDFDAEVDNMVVFELVVPDVAKVPPPRQHLALEQLMVHQSSVTSTVPGTILLQLRANDTASATAWRTTATLSVPEIRSLSRC